MRIDKFLWCARLCGTRSIATDECKRERVRVNDRLVKASYEVKTSDVISLRRPPIWRVFAVKTIPTSRVGAKLVPQILDDRTSFDELLKQELARKVRAAQRGPGEGRPTKRDRRDMERFTDEG